jgi:hypothetical protein
MMDRRGILQLAGLAGPGSALAQISVAPDWKPDVFDAHQNETVVVLSELIIPATDTPGAKAALVNRWMDRLFGAVPAEQRDEFLAGLNWLDGQSNEKHGKPFVRLSEAQQVEMLSAMERGGGMGQRFFLQAKMWTSRTTTRRRSGCGN